MFTPPTRFALALLLAAPTAACSGPQGSGDDQRAAGSEVALEAPEATPSPVESPTAPEVADVTEVDLDALRAEAGARNEVTAAMLRLLPAPNAFYAPLSLQSALAMLREGAQGDSEAELRNLLRQGEDEASAHFGALLRALLAAHGEEGTPTLRIAQDVWVQEGQPLQEAYLEATRRHFSASVLPAPFSSSPESAREAINARVAEQTENRIPSLMPEGSVHAETRFVLTSALYFHGAWQSGFQAMQTRDLPFHLADGTTVDVPTMQQTTRIGIFRSQAVQMYTLPYQGGTMEMLFVLPADLDGFLSAPDMMASVEEGLANMRTGEANIVVPTFEARFGFDAGAMLRTLGVEAIFSPTLADLGGISEDRPLFVDVIQHEAFVRVDETGTEAAGATGIGIRTTAMIEPEAPAILDRPFAWFIRDTRTGLLLFAGRMDNPALAPVQN